jgi:8-hydroxy-5-deazaflavin:NADPH oxidoreductase
MKDIGIVGAGNIGRTLARQLRALGHRVRIANSRGPGSLSSVAPETGATPATVHEAAECKDLVVIAIPEASVAQMPRDIFRKTSAVVIDAGNYYPTRDGHIAEIDNGLTESQWVAKVLGINVVKAFNNIVAESLDKRGAPRGTPGRICLPVAGEDTQAKAMVLGVIDALGFDGIDAGGLVDSWRQQPGTPAYCRDLDAVALKAALDQAIPTEIERYRARADEQAAPYFRKLST